MILWKIRIRKIIERRVKKHMEQNLNEVKASIEAILFAVGDCVELEKIAFAIGHDVETTKRVLKVMMEEYEREHRGIMLIELDGSYQLCTKKQYFDTLIKIVNAPKKNVLTDVLLETLAIIAYKQPITKAEIEAVRGVKSDHAVNKLVEYKLVQEVGRLEALGRPILFGTTDEFLRSFGVSSVDELPLIHPAQVEEFKQEAMQELDFV